MGKKKSFLIYFDWEETLNMLTDKELGIVFRALFRYAKNGEPTDFQDRTLSAIFTILKGHIDRDIRKYEEICELRSEYGKKGGLKSGITRKNKSISGTSDNEAKQSKSLKTETNEADKDNEKDIDKDNDTDKEIIPSFSEKTVCAYSDDFLVFWKVYPKKVGKAEAFKQWKKGKIRKNDLDDILCALNWQKNSSQWCASSGRYIPNPSTYISQRRWEDEPQNDNIENISDPSRYTDGDELPEFIMKGEF